MSSKDIAVSVRGLSKCYTINHQDEKHTMASEALLHRLKNPFRRAETEEFWALRDVSFDVQKGDVVGIIGRNGAGKSTLLKILSQITEPTAGEIKLYGRVGSLLEVGTGFHPELTGRENIFLNGAILGMRRKEIEKQFDAIVDFAEIEQFIDTPVKRYSSGMYVRLAFAVAAHLNPEILIVDEVLAVGDAEFQKKCLGKMQDVAQQGRTVLFVSHNMGFVRQLCNKALLLQKGEVEFNGDVTEGIQRYFLSDKKGSRSILEHILNGDPRLKISSIEINDYADDYINLQKDENTLKIEIVGYLQQPLHIDMEVRVTDIFGALLGVFSPSHERGYVKEHPAGQFCLTNVIELPKTLNRGEYYLHMAFSEPDVSMYLDVPYAAIINVEGVKTLIGRTFSYYDGAGWLFLQEASEKADKVK